MLQTYVSSVSDVSELCLSVSYMDVEKVDPDVAYVAMAIQVSIQNVSSTLNV
jgi:hypothetical protein